MSKIKFILTFIILFLLFGCATKNTQDNYNQNNNPPTQNNDSEDVDNETNEEDDTNPTESSILKIHYIDVGQADSILIQLPNNENLLIDAGNDGDQNTIINYLRNQGVERLDYVIGTHPHEDHIGALEYVINTFDIGKVYLPNKTAATQTYLDVLNAIDSKGLMVEKSEPGVKLFDTVISNQTLKASILSPYNQSYPDTNDYSIVLKLHYGTTSYLFMGDAEEAAEKVLIEHQVNLKADVLKVGHHGSVSSTFQEFLDLVQPKIAIISVGTGNTYDHPGQETINRLTRSDVEVLRTDLLGTIIVSSNGTTITFNNSTITGNSTNTEDPIGTTTPTGPVSNGIYINEIMPNPSTGQEWVELYNSNNFSVDISGYVIDDIEGGSSPIIINANQMIGANSFYILYLSSAVFNNTGDDVRLLSAEGILLDSYTYGATTKDQSFYRITDGGSWSSITSSTSTPNESNQ